MHQHDIIINTTTTRSITNMLQAAISVRHCSTLPWLCDVGVRLQNLREHADSGPQEVNYVARAAQLELQDKVRALSFSRFFRMLVATHP